MVQVIIDPKEAKLLKEIVEREKQDFLELVKIDDDAPEVGVCDRYEEKASVTTTFRKLVEHLEEKYKIAEDQAIFVAMKLLWDLDFKLVLENKFEVEYQQVTEE